MKFYKGLLCIVALMAILPFSASATSRDFIKWTFKADSLSPNTYLVKATGKITKGYHIYSQKHVGDPTSPGIDHIPFFTFEKNADVSLSGKLREEGTPLKVWESILEYDMLYFENSVTLVQKIKISKNTVLKGQLEYQVCDHNHCERFDIDKFTLKFENIPEVAGAADSTTDTNNNAGAVDINSAATPSTPDTGTTANSTVVSTGNEENDLSQKSLWEIFAIGFGAGLIAFLMPCIYALLPITVSFFTKRSKDKKTGLKNAVYYSLSIIFIFTAIGALITVLFTEKTMYEISTSLWFNLFVFVTFVIFGISFLGAFEITLPSSWSSKLDSKANANSFGGIFFMAAVLVVVSFSCTSAFISSLIVYIVKSQNSLGGLVGFFGFGFAIALPFALFAFFPGLLNNVAKSGGWLNNIKVTMGFIELAMALKFLSNVDLEYHWHLLDMEVYLSLWIIIFGVLGFYLLGKIKLSHDDELPKNVFGQPYLSVTRLLCGIATLAFTVYMIPGLWGAPLTGISGWLPERKTLDFNIHDNLMAVRANTVIEHEEGHISPVKYAGSLKSELPGIEAFFDYHEALAAAKQMKKPVLLDFTGHSCVNCRKMERAVLSKPEVLKQLKEHFIVASLYCDDKTTLIKGDEYISKHDKSRVTNIGEKNFDIEVELYHSAGQPIYIFVDEDGKLIKHAGGFEADVPRFLRIIEEVKARYKELHP